MKIETYLNEKRELVDSFLSSYLASPLSPPVLSDAMTYSLFAGGKRIRPILALAAYEACGGTADVVPYASALELIHTYSLIHDDLPAMDNDDLRRGKPTSHKVFGEGVAILAGDALLTEAFSLLSQSAYARVRISPGVLLRLVRELAMAAGAHGMVGGQADDILSSHASGDGETLPSIHARKTGALITASVRMGAMLACASKKRLAAITKYGERIGLAFQIIDDVLDIQGTTEELGKPAGADEKRKKMTYPALYGIEQSVRKAEALIEGALSVLEFFPADADPLREIARYILKRRN